MEAKREEEYWVEKRDEEGDKRDDTTERDSAPPLLQRCIRLT